MTESAANNKTRVRLSVAERSYLIMGLDQPAGKLPLFDAHGQEISPKTIRSCLQKGLIEQWFSNPMNPSWRICKLTKKGRQVLSGYGY